MPADTPDVFFEALPLPVCALDGDGRILRLNPIAKQVFGAWLQPGQAAADALAALGTQLPWPPADRRPGQRWQSPHRQLRLPDGRTFRIEPLGLGDAAYLLLRDISEEVAVAARLQESESRFRVMADSAPVMIWMSNLDKLCDWFNQPWLDFSGRTLEQEWGFGWAEGVHPDDYDRCVEIYTTAFDRREPFTMDYRLRRRDGVYRWILDNGAPRYAADGQFTGYIGSCIDIHERKDLEAELRRQAAALQLQDRRKDEFLAMLAHELRNPLAPIASAAGVLKAVEAGDATLARLRGVIERQVGQLRRLVDDLLDVSRVTQGKIRLAPAAIDLGEVIDRALELSAERVQAGGHRVAVSRPEGPLPLQGDAARLAQALANLLDNAAKYTPQPATLQLVVERQGGDLAIRVIDPGEGIAPAFLPEVFELFTQHDQSLARSRGGLGVGLHIAREIARLHGGELTVHSEGPGRGTECRLSLPARPVAQPGEGVANSDGRSAATEGRRVLVIEDNADAAETLRLLLELWGHTVQWAADGPSALARVAQWPPHIVLCDIGLPGQTGYELVQPLKRALAAAGAADATVVALTGYGEARDRARALEAGFDGLLVKPLSPEDLQRFLQEQAQRRPSAQASAAPLPGALAG
jgi:PAS domain S-box-containing protein